MRHKHCDQFPDLPWLPYLLLDAMCWRNHGMSWHTVPCHRNFIFRMTVFSGLRRFSP
jgi:hypothetical protein